MQYVVIVGTFDPPHFAACATPLVDVPKLVGMLRKTVLQLAKQVEAGGRVPGRHKVHRNHQRKVNAHNVNVLQQRMRDTGARMTLHWMCDQLHLYFGIQITDPGLSKALAAHKVCHKKVDGAQQRK